MNVLHCVVFSLTHSLYPYRTSRFALYFKYIFMYVNRMQFVCFFFLYFSVVCLICIRSIVRTHVQRTFSLSIAMKMALSTRFVFCCHNWICWRIQMFTYTPCYSVQFTVYILLDVLGSKCITNKCKMVIIKLWSANEWKKVCNINCLSWTVLIDLLSATEQMRTTK